MPSNYHQRIEQLQTDFDLQNYVDGIRSWMNQRPAVRNHDKDLPTMAEKNAPGEITEQEEERNRYGKSDYDGKAEAVEAFDIGFFITTYMVAQNLPIDDSEIRRRANGYGNRSDIFENMRGVSRNIDRKKPESDLHHLLTLWFASLADLPEGFNEKEIAGIVFQKDSANYPAKFFGDKHPYTKETLNEEQLNRLFVHSRKCLKFIRNFYKTVLGLDRTHGLLEKDYQPYEKYILDFPNTEKAFVALRIQLYLDHNLIPPTEFVS